MKYVILISNMHTKTFQCKWNHIVSESSFFLAWGTWNKLNQCQQSSDGTLVYYRISILAMFCNSAKLDRCEPCCLQEYSCVHTSSLPCFTFNQDPPDVQTTFCPETTSKSQLQWPKGPWLSRRERCPSYRSGMLPAELQRSWKPNLCHCSHRGTT